MEWISVKDRLPEEPKGRWNWSRSMYLVTCSDGTVQCLSYAKREIRGKTVCRWESEFGRIYRGDITYWMPLPEPPRCEVDE